MISLAKRSIRRPRAALGVWLLIAGVLIAIGFGVSHAMSPSITVVSGTQSAHARALADQQFGPAQLVPILLEGSKAELSRVGPRLVIALNNRPHTLTLSAWDAGTASAGLRPSPTAAMIVVSVDRAEKNVVDHDEPQIERLVRHVVGPAPITPYITGQPSIDRALREAATGDATAAVLQLETTGKAVLVGGTGLVLALALVAIIGPTQLMVSVGAAALTSAAIAMVAGMIPFATTELINVRELGVGVGVGVTVLLVALALRPVLLPAAEVVLGRIGWWPTHGPRAPKELPPQTPMRRPARTRLPHGRPRPRGPIRREAFGGER
jgi:uncharacterized membrane protein YdfJ with MMPL/SSD domain